MILDAHHVRVPAVPSCVIALGNDFGVVARLLAFLLQQKLADVGLVEVSS